MHDFNAVITWTPAAGAYGQHIYIIKDGQAVGESPLGPTTNTYTVGVIKDSNYVVKVVTKNMQGQSSAALEITFKTPPSLVPPPTNGGVVFEPIN